MKIVIIGAGVGGLACARGLIAQGHDVELYEQGEELRTGGTGLILWSNGTGIMRDLGVSLNGLGCRLDSVETGYDDGTRLWQVDLNRIADRYQLPNLVIPRGDIVRRLADGLPEGVLRLGKRCTRLVEGDKPTDPVVVSFDDGTEVKADLLIGADGHRSAVRRHLVGDEPAAYTGFASWHGLNAVPIRLSTSTTGMTVYGDAGFCVLLPAGEGRLQWVFETPWNDGELVPPGRLGDSAPVPRGPQPPGTVIANLKARFGHWASPIPEVLESLTDDDVALFPHIRHRVPSPSWGRGPITLVGDSVHAIPPALAQGVNQVLEDAWVLIRSLAKADGDTVSMLRAYEAERGKRVRNLTRYAGVMSKGNVPPRFLRLAPIPVTGIHHATLRWLSNYLHEPRRSSSLVGAVSSS